MWSCTPRLTSVASYCIESYIRLLTVRLLQEQNCLNLIILQPVFLKTIMCQPHLNFCFHFAVFLNAISYVLSV